MALCEPVDTGSSGEAQELSYATVLAGPFTTMMQLLTSLSVTGPALLVLAVISLQPRLNNFRYWFIANLLVCNVLVSVLFLPAAIDTAGHMLKDQIYSIQFVISFAAIPSVACSLISCVIFTDIFCFLFISNYQDFLTARRAAVMMSVAWGLSCGVVTVLSIWRTTNSSGDHFILFITCVISLVMKIIIAIAAVCLNVILFYYWSKVNIRLQAEVLNVPTADNKCHLRKQIDIFVKVESCIKPFFAFFSNSLFNVAMQIVKVVIASYTNGFYNTPIPFIIFIILTWMECIFCVLAYSISLRATFHSFYFGQLRNNRIVPT